MLMLLAAPQVHRLVVAILDMQPHVVFIKLAAGIQIDHVEHDMAGSDDVEGRIEDMLRDGHAVSSTGFRHSGTRLLTSVVSCSWMLLGFQLVCLSLICMSNDSANGLCANTGSRWSDSMRKICSPASLRVARSRPSPSRSTMSRKPKSRCPLATA